MLTEILVYTIVFIYGILIGSFLNVLIYRIPKKENFVTTRSHCMKCGNVLKWYDLIPVFSYLCLGGKCRKCKDKISPQYPMIEAFNGILYVFIFWRMGFQYTTIIFCLLVSALIVLSVIDFRTFEIPVGINYFILFLGLVRLILDYKNWSMYIIGFFAVSAFLYLILIVTKGRGIGGGDIKLMAVCGFILGWKQIILAFILGCIIGSVIHIIRMRITKADHVLAMGPYLSVGIFIAMSYGNAIIDWYLSYML